MSPGRVERLDPSARLDLDADLLGLEFGAGNGFLDDDGAELRRGNPGERAAELADCGADGGNDDDVFHLFSPGVSDEVRSI